MIFNDSNGSANFCVTVTPKQYKLQVCSNFQHKSSSWRVQWCSSNRLQHFQV